LHVSLTPRNARRTPHAAHLRAQSGHERGSARRRHPPLPRAQIFINTKHNSFLDYFDRSTPSKHPVFGKVIDGMDVLSSIEKTPTRQDRPIEPVVVSTIEISE
jgi:cyclophilin family peptidyl-prolyl cis-trans isomerase